MRRLAAESGRPKMRKLAAESGRPKMRRLAAESGIIGDILVLLVILLCRNSLIVLSEYYAFLERLRRRCKHMVNVFLS